MAKPASGLDANQVLQHGFDDASKSHRMLNLGQLVPSEYDYMSMTYVAAGNGAGEVETVTYKSGGAAGTTVATLTMTYDASNSVATVTRS